MGLDPAEEGNYGQVIRMWHDDDIRELLANSFQEWFKKYIQRLKEEKYNFNEEWRGIIEK